MVEVLYKYMTAERVLTCLPEVDDGTLRATQPAALNDPFECAVRPVIFSQAYEKRYGNQELAEVLSSIHGAALVSAADVVRAKEQFGSLYLRNLFAAQLSRKFGIVSFSDSPRHPLMWTHYASDGTGFVVGYDFDQLRYLIAGEGFLRRVTYLAEIPLILDYRVLTYTQGNLHNLLSVKSDH